MAMKVPDRPTPALQGREGEGEWRGREVEGRGGEERGGEGKGKWDTDGYYTSESSLPVDSAGLMHWY